MAAIGLITAWLLSIVGLTLLRGFVLTVLWSWFVLTVFPGLPDLGLGAAIGLSLVVGFLVYQYRPATQEDRDKSFGTALIETLGAGVCFYGATLLLALIIHIWVP